MSWEDDKKLKFTDWKVFIDNTSEWFDEINKMYADSYVETRLISVIYGKLRSFISSRRANLSNYDEINTKLNSIKSIIFSAEYKQAQKDKESGKYDTRVLVYLDEIVGLISIGLSDGELIPKFMKKETLPYEEDGTHRDHINRIMYDTNRTTMKDETKDNN